jgi:hypothetical protein
MILIDFNQVLFATFFGAVKQHTNVEIQESVMRTMTLNMIREIRKRFPHDDNIVICSDSTHNWRKEYFPHYKHRRNRRRQASDVDWTSIYQSMDKIRDEICDNFPYTYIQVEGCEADDIIGTLCCYAFSSDDIEKVTIISGDKDFMQLHRKGLVEQYDVQHKKITCDDPVAYLTSHILKGDSNDDIPNVLSDDNVFLEGRRQNRLTKKRKEEISDIQNNQNHKYYRNWMRNMTLIDLSKTPEHLARKIVDLYKRGPVTPNRSKLWTYFTKNRLVSLLENIDDF